MSIHKRQTTSGPRYDVKLRRPDGTQYQKSFRTKKEAEAYVARERADQMRGVWLDDRHADITFSDVATRWLLSNANKRDNTLTRDTLILNRHLLPELGHIPIREIVPTDIERLYNKWIKSGLAAATIRRHRAILSGIFNLALRDSIIIKSPIFKIPTPRVTPRKGWALSDEELARLIHHVPAYYRPFIFILATTGLRWSEAAGLEIRHFNALSNPPVLVIEQGAHDSKNGRVITPPKSHAANRTLALAQQQVDVIAAYLSMTGRTAVHANEPLFVTPNGKPMNNPNFRQRVWVPTLKAAELEGLKIKDLRKTVATNLLSRGFDPKTSTAYMGHEDLRTTIAHYAQATSENLLRASQSMVSFVYTDQTDFREII